MLSDGIAGFRATGYETCISGFRCFCYLRSRQYRSHCPGHCKCIQPEAVMFPIIRSRWDGRILSRRLRKSLASFEDNWKVGADEEGHPTLSNEGFRIVLVPRGVRLFDAIHVYRDNAE